MVLLIMAGLSQGAFAHNYLPASAGGGTTVIPDISVSRAAYRELSAPDQVDVYQFTAHKGEELYIQMTVPLLDRLQDFAPVFVLTYMGEGQPEFAGAEAERGIVIDPPHDVVDQLHPHTGGEKAEASMVALQYDAQAPLAFNEPFTGTRYWIRQTLSVTAPADGMYRIGVYSPDGSSGKYVLAPGKRESFGVVDLFTFAAVRITVRSFCEQPIWPDVAVWSVLDVAIVAGICLGVAALIIH
jgi:hypothetical protein